MLNVKEDIDALDLIEAHGRQSQSQVLPVNSTNNTPLDPNQNYCQQQVRLPPRPNEPPTVRPLFEHEH